MNIEGNRIVADRVTTDLPTGIPGVEMKLHATTSHEYAQLKPKKFVYPKKNFNSGFNRAAYAAGYEKIDWSK